MKAPFISHSCRYPFVVIFLTGICSLFTAVVSSAQDTPEEWEAKAKEYLGKDPPEYYNAADAYIYAGEAALDLEKYEAAKGYFEEALKISESRDMKSISARAYDGLGDVANKKEEFASALENHLKAAALFIEIEEYLDAGWAYIDAGSDAYENGDIAAAITHLEEASTTFLEDDSYANASFAYILLGWMMTEEEEYEKAIGYYMEAVDIANEGEIFNNAAAAYEAAGDAAKANLDCSMADSYWNEAKKIYDLIGKPFTIPDCKLEVIITSPEANSTYNQGEAIHLVGELRYADTQVTPVNSKVKIRIDVPECNTHEKGREKYIDTDDSGNFSVISFAGWNEGTYQLEVEAWYLTKPDQEEVSASSTVEINVAEPALVNDLTVQMANILNRYSEAITEGPIRKHPEARDYLNSLFRYMIVGGFDNIYSETDYGNIHNMHLVDTEFDPTPNFTCAGYQTQVLVLLDKIRYHEDPEVRKWLSGLDYTPISRGTINDEGEEDDFHVAVALYRIGTDWKTDPHTVILDPWYEQKPMAYSMTDWCLLGTYGFSPWRPKIDPEFKDVTNTQQNIWNGYPLTGNVICSSYTSYGSIYEPLRKYKVMVNCPVTLLVSDSAGNQTGVLPDDSYIQDFPASIYYSATDEKVTGWYVELPDGTFDLTVTGESKGEFHVTVTGEGVGNEYLYYGAQSIAEGEQATIRLGPGNPEPELVLPDGTHVQPNETTSAPGNMHPLSESKWLTIHPNPFYHNTHISYHISESSRVRIEIYSVNGELVRTFVEDHQFSGWHTLSWNGKNDSGKPLNGGIYFCKIVTDCITETSKMILAR